MRSFNIRSALLGFGLGLICASIVFSVLLSGAPPRGGVGGAGEAPPEEAARATGRIILLDGAAAPDATGGPAAGAAARDGAVTLTIVPGDTAANVANKLSGAGLVANAGQFTEKLREKGLESGLIAGTYQLDPDKSVDELISILTSK